ncbi:MAG: flagellar hook-basal body complex protein, partial [Parahaliea sp.]
MDHLVYVAAAGAASIAERQAVVSHNLANVSTPGFKADLVQAQSRYLDGPGISSSRIPVVSEKEGSNTESGHIRATGRDLDVAVNGDGWIGVLANDGSEALSRRGDLR